MFLPVHDAVVHFFARQLFPDLLPALVQVAVLGLIVLRKLANSGVTGLSRMPHALGAESGFQAGARFSFLDLMEIARPASPLRWMDDLAFGLIGTHKVIERDAMEFLEHLLETNSTRVQSDILIRLQESRARLEVEIRKLLHEVARIAVQALINARATRAAGAPAIEATDAKSTSSNGLDQDVGFKDGVGLVKMHSNGLWNLTLHTNCTQVRSHVSAYQGFEGVPLSGKSADPAGLLKARWMGSIPNKRRSWLNLLVSRCSWFWKGCLPPNVSRSCCMTCSQCPLKRSPQLWDVLQLRPGNSPAVHAAGCKVRPLCPTLIYLNSVRLWTLS